MGLDNPLHVIILLVLVMLVFGAKRLPEIGRSLGEGMRGFKDSISGTGPSQTEILTPTATATAPPPAPAAEPPVVPAPAPPPAPPVDAG